MHAYRIGEDVMVPKMAQFPPVCLKCGASHDLVGRQHAMTWTPTWAKIVAAALVLVATVLVVLPLLLRKQASFNVPLCRTCDRRWASAKKSYALSFLPGLAVILGSFVIIIAANLTPAIGVSLLLLGIVLFVALPTTVHYVKVRPATLWARKMDDQYAQIVGIAPQAVAQIASDAHAGHRAPVHLPPHLGMG